MHMHSQMRYPLVASEYHHHHQLNVHVHGAEEHLQAARDSSPHRPNLSQPSANHFYELCPSSLCSYPMIFTLENPLLFISVRSAFPTAASVATGMFVDGYVALHSHEPARNNDDEILTVAVLRLVLDADSIQGDALILEALKALEEVVRVDVDVVAIQRAALRGRLVPDVFLTQGPAARSSILRSSSIPADNRKLRSTCKNNKQTARTGLHGTT
jgi:hypothetical protein